MTKIKPLGDYVQIEPIHSDHVGDILLTANAQETDKGFTETGLVIAIGSKVEDITNGDIVILDQFAIEPVFYQGDTIYLHKASRLKGIVLNAN